jgi:hypothetical protein
LQKLGPLCVLFCSSYTYLGAQNRKRDTHIGRQWRYWQQSQESEQGRTVATHTRWRSDIGRTQTVIRSGLSLRDSAINVARKFDAGVPLISGRRTHIIYLVAHFSNSFVQRLFIPMCTHTITIESVRKHPRITVRCNISVLFASVSVNRFTVDRFTRFVHSGASRQRTNQNQG